MGAKILLALHRITTKAAILMIVVTKATMRVNVQIYSLNIVLINLLKITNTSTTLKHAAIIPIAMPTFLIS